MVDAQGNGLDNVRVYTFTDDDRYSSIQGDTDENGIVTLDIPDGNFKFRADYRGHQYWSDSVETPNQDNAIVQTNEQKISVSVTDAHNNTIGGVRVYAFTHDDRYTGIQGDTDESGTILLDVPEGNFKFRADYRAHQYWSPVIETPEQETAVIPTNEQELHVTVVDGNNNGINNARVYVFTEDERYTGLFGNTQENGTLILNLPEGNFKLRADYRSHQYWSDNIDMPTQNTAVIQTNEQEVSVTILNGNRSGISNVYIYIFTDDNRYVGIYGNTDTDGKLSLPLPEGIYKFRADYRGYQYWSNTFSPPNDTSITLNIQETISTVHTVSATGQNMGNILIYAYTVNGAYTGIYGRTDSSGQIDFALPTGQYSFRAYHQSQEFWSDTVTPPEDTTITIGD